MSGLRPQPASVPFEQRLECGRLALRTAEVIRSGPLLREGTGATLLALVNVRAAVKWLAQASSPGDAYPPEPLPPDVHTVLERGADDDLAATPSEIWSDLELLRAYGEQLLSSIEDPIRRARAMRLRAQLRLLVLPALVVTLGLLSAWWLFRSHEVSLGKSWTTSSKPFVCEPGLARCAGVETSIFFVTDFEPEPWFEIDLGATYEVTRIQIRNRSDCCADRAVPLAVETSLDKKRYRTVARKFTIFDEWDQRFPTTRARYVRVRVTGPSILHLEAVRVYGTGPK